MLWLKHLFYQYICRPIHVDWLFLRSRSEPVWYFILIWEWASSFVCLSFRWNMCTKVCVNHMHLMDFGTVVKSIKQQELKVIIELTLEFPWSGLLLFFAGALSSLERPGIFEYHVNYVIQRIWCLSGVSITQTHSQTHKLITRITPQH